MRTKKTRRVSGILFDQKSGPSALLQKANFLRGIENTVKDALPLPLSAHCKIGPIRDQTLFMYVDAPIWNSQLRFHIPTIIRVLAKNHKLFVKHIRVSTRPSQEPYRAPPRRATISPNTRQLLKNTAASFEDAKLREAFEKLARKKT